MVNIKIIDGFRFGGAYYGTKAKNVPDDAAEFAIKHGLAEAAKKAPQNKSKGAAPKNK